jgi:hypothetical protein
MNPKNIVENKISLLLVNDTFRQRIRSTLVTDHADDYSPQYITAVRYGYKQMHSTQ